MIGAGRSARSGFVLLEVLLALALFGIVGVSLLSALEKIGHLATEVRRESQMTRLLDSELRAAMSLPQLEEGAMEAKTLDERDQLTVQTFVTPLEDVVGEALMQNEEGRLLQQMFHIEVRASWWENNQWREMSAATWRYARLYQP